MIFFNKNTRPPPGKFQISRQTHRHCLPLAFNKQAGPFWFGWNVFAGRGFRKSRRFGRAAGRTKWL